MAISAIPVCKAQLVDLFLSDDQLADVEIQYGRKANPQNEYMCFQGTSDWTREWANLAVNPQIKESFVINYLIGAYKPGQNQQDATERVFEIFAQAERLLREHVAWARDNADSPVLWAELRVNELFEYSYLEGQVAVIDGGIFFQTQI